jgi:acetyltransferase-like isoleucine patch superfamily enzyme
LTYCSDQCVIGFGTLFSSPECKIGENVYIGPNCAIGRVIIENDVLIGNNVHLLSGKRQHDYMDSLRPIRLQSGIYETITVKEDSWIGNGAIILAEVGRKCVVGAGSVVTRPVQDYSVVAGNPARAIRRRTSCNESD